jgi:hypothetical protein
MDATFKKIIDQLRQKTSIGETNWTTTDTPNEYKLVLTDAVIKISVYSNKHGVPCVSCSITNSRGDLIFKENSIQSSEDGQYLTNFFILVRDTYTGKDAVVSSILKELNSGKIVGEVEESDLPF